jgi:hypothetical protein
LAPLLGRLSYHSVADEIDRDADEHSGEGMVEPRVEAQSVLPYQDGGEATEHHRHRGARAGRVPEGLGDEQDRTRGFMIVCAFAG